MEQHSRDFLQAADRAIADPTSTGTRKALGQLMPKLREQAIVDFGGSKDFDALRTEVQAIRQHALEHLAHYLESFASAARENGSSVHFARNGSELNDIVIDICARTEAQRIAKGKSMITEETGLNAALEGAGFSVRETDLGEYIIQEAGETPSHIVGPALHKSKEEIRELFLERHDLGDRDLSDAPEMVAEARKVLREDFLAADVGIIGSNALIAENGYSMLVTNEGNGDLCANLPRVLIVCTSVDRVLPRASDAMAMLRLLVRSTTGQAVSCYTSFYAGPRRPTDVDGPLETHFVLLDNHRSEILASDYSEMLQCIRCGACLNHCPVYMNAGGHAYGWVYPGPMGSVLTPLLTSLEESAHLPDACTACGRCEEVCPAAIPLPDLLRDLRRDKFEQRVTAKRWRWGMQLHTWLALHPRLYQSVTNISAGLMHRIGRRNGVIRRLPFAGGWLKARDLPTPAGKTFQKLHQESLQE
ncbi:lactate utilization protein B [Congregibacter variabilis]|uniref:Lactate utilization protein B n=1 Tax=Congregibacter variabilis TaxID=3081200 RepID=A0ABZ0I605_9GAMM|nr:lactate utilization protein B [Congregibacter sp. IMCC43200]